MTFRHIPRFQDVGPALESLGTMSLGGENGTFPQTKLQKAS